jgi:hypothetical protein
MKNNKYTNLNSNLKRCGCTSIRYIKQGNREYIKTTGGDGNCVLSELKAITRFSNVYCTSNGPKKTFTFRVI